MTTPATPDKIVHFETLWEATEKVAKNQYSDTATILAKLLLAVNDFSKIHQVHMNNPKVDVARPMKNKAIGEVLFLLTALSAHEDLDVYAALKGQLDVANFQAQMNSISFSLEKPAEDGSTSIDIIRG